MYRGRVPARYLTSTDWRNGSVKVTCSNHVSVTEVRDGGGRLDGTTHRYLTLREWGARQDPAMSVEEVVAAKMADKRKVEITLEDIMDAVTPF